ncbi:MAG: HemK/PrmC family methyltransferase, partial [Gammaproteobacteria bacterium]
MSNSITRKAWLSSAAQVLTRVSDSSQLDARLLLCQVLDISKSQLLAWPEQTINTQQQSALQKLIERRLAGEPMAYILGSAEFWGLELMVSPAVLVPRPETELIVEITLETINEQGISAPTILDLGTGSGAIALALASELPDATLLAVDVSESALQVAEANRKRHGLTNV